MVSRIGNLEHGLAGIARWRVDDETHLPKSPRLAPAYAPSGQRLNEILRRPSLDERLPDLLAPEWVTPDLMEPSVMSATRRDVAQTLRFASMPMADGTDPEPEEREAFMAAAELLETGIVLDEEIRTALAALLRG
ncbi:MAG: hypothetical protein AAGF48_15390 [Pseudomonadota bacterium]